MADDTPLPLGIKLLSALYLFGGTIALVAGAALGVSSETASLTAYGLVAAVILLAAGYLVTASALLLRRPWAVDAAIGLSVITLFLDLMLYFSDPDVATVTRMALTIAIIFYLREKRGLYRED